MINDFYFPIDYYLCYPKFGFVWPFTLLLYNHIGSAFSCHHLIKDISCPYSVSQTSALGQSEIPVKTIFFFLPPTTSLFHKKLLDQPIGTFDQLPVRIVFILWIFRQTKFSVLSLAKRVNDFFFSRTRNPSFVILMNFWLL